MLPPALAWTWPCYQEQANEGERGTSGASTLGIEGYQSRTLACSLARSLGQQRERERERQ